MRTDSLRSGVWRCWTDPRLLLLDTFNVLTSPYRIANRIYRCATRRRWFEISLTRLTIPALTPRETLAAQGAGLPHIVLMGTGFGESKLMARVTDELSRTAPCVVSWALRDPVCIENVRKERPSQSVVVFPFDSVVSCTRWIKRVRPDVVVFVERFRFPSLAACAKHCGAKVAVMNGRSRPRSDRKHGLISWFYGWTFRQYDAFAMQNAEFAESLRGLAKPGATVIDTGNVKFEVDPKVIGEETVRSLEAWLRPAQGAPLVAAGSSENRAEDEFVLDAFCLLRKSAPARLLLAPRRIERADDVCEACRARGLSYSRRSGGPGDADVYVLDTIGELFAAYQFCKGAYVGGALNGNGHNILEPVVFGLPVAYGPERGFFGDIQALCEEIGIGHRLRTKEQLAEFWGSCLSDEGFCERSRTLARDAVRTSGGAAAATAKMLAALVGDARAAEGVKLSER